MNRLSLRVVCLGLLAVAGPAGLAVADDGTEKSFTVQVAGGRVSVHAADSRLQEVVQELGRQLGFEVEADIDEDLRVAVDFDKLPIEDAIRRLCKPVGYVQVASPKTGKITKVILTPRSARAARAASRQDAPAEKPQFSPEVLAAAFGPSDPPESPKTKKAPEEQKSFGFKLDPQQAKQEAEAAAKAADKDE